MSRIATAVVGIFAACIGASAAWAQSADFYKRKAEDQACRQLVTDAVRTLTGARLRLTFDLREQDEQEPEAEPTISEDDMIERFKAEFEAEEIVPHDDEEPTA